MAGVHEGPEFGVGDFVLLSSVDLQAFMENLQKRSVVRPTRQRAVLSEMRLCLCARLPTVTSNKCVAVRKVATPLLICHMGSDSVTCHPAEVTFPPLPQPKLVLD